MSSKALLHLTLINHSALNPVFFPSLYCNQLLHIAEHLVHPPIHLFLQRTFNKGRGGHGEPSLNGSWSCCPQRGTWLTEIVALRPEHHWNQPCTAQCPPLQSFGFSASGVGLRTCISNLPRCHWPGDHTLRTADFDNQAWVQRRLCHCLCPPQQRLGLILPQTPSIIVVPGRGGGLPKCSGCRGRVLQPRASAHRTMETGSPISVHASFPVATQ